jgi:F420-dependent methylenetetrahydromethanopterin dehydrogenase
MSDVKIGFVKLGNLGMSQVIDLILDEIAASLVPVQRWVRTKQQILKL